MNSGIPFLKAPALFLFIFLAGLAACNNSSSPKKEAVIITPPNKFSAAADSLNKLVLQYPDSVIYRQQLILQLEQDNQFDEALKHNDTLLKKIGNNPVIWLNRGALLEAKNDTANAIIAYENAVTLQSNNQEASLRLAKLYAETKNEKALQLIDFLFKNQLAFGYETDLILMRGIYYRNNKEFDKALTCFTQCINDKYSFLDAYIEKGVLLYELKKYKESIAVFEKATTVNNTFADGYYWIARNEEALNKQKEAIENYKRALALDQSFEEAREALKRLGVIK
jgi:tetratricopeptide (TPR) repeat protein